MTGDEASISRVMSAAGILGGPDRLRGRRAALLYCFHYDPKSGRYGLVVMNLVRLGGVMTLLFMAGFILIMRRRESRPPAPSRA